MKPRKSSKNTLILIITIVICVAILALCIAGALLQERLQPETTAEKLLNGIPLLFVGLFAMVGVAAITSAISTYLSRKEYCTFVTEAVCVRLDSHYSSDTDGHGSTVYSPIYEFTYNGEKQTIRNNHYTSLNLAPEVGSVEILHIDIDEHGPHDYYIGNPLNGLLVFLITGLIFSVPALIILIIAVVT